MELVHSELNSYTDPKSFLRTNEVLIELMHP
jgi:hypothetical protein